MFKYQVPSKSVQWEPSFSIRTNGRMDMTKLIVAFRCFASLKVVCLLFVMSEHSEKKLWKGYCVYGMSRLQVRRIRESLGFRHFTLCPVRSLYCCQYMTPRLLDLKSAIQWLMVIEQVWVSLSSAPVNSLVSFGLYKSSIAASVIMLV